MNSGHVNMRILCIEVLQIVSLSFKTTVKKLESGVIFLELVVILDSQLFVNIEHYITEIDCGCNRSTASKLTIWNIFALTKSVK